jgi:transcriptional regulator with XRE-family HTH domain
MKAASEALTMKKKELERNLGLRVGVAVRRYREHASLTQAQLAEKVNVAQSEISLIEQGKRSRLATLDRVASALGRRLSDLIRFAEDVGTAEEVAAEAREFVDQAKRTLKVTS